MGIVNALPGLTGCVGMVINSVSLSDDIGIGSRVIVWSVAIGISSIITVTSRGVLLEPEENHSIGT